MELFSVNSTKLDAWMKVTGLETTIMSTTAQVLQQKSRHVTKRKPFWSNSGDTDLDLLRRLLSREWDLLLRGLLDLLLLLEWDLRRDLLFERLPK